MELFKFGAGKPGLILHEQLLKSGEYSIVHQRAQDVEQPEGALGTVAQNRQAKLSERRALLDLHVNLLVERKVAKLISLIEELRRDLPQVQDRRDDQAEAMTHPLDPHQTVVNLEQSIERRIESAQLADRSAEAEDDEGGVDAPAPPAAPPQAR